MTTIRPNREIGEADIITLEEVYLHQSVFDVILPSSKCNNCHSDTPQGTLGKRKECDEDHSTFIFQGRYLTPQ